MPAAKLIETNRRIETTTTELAGGFAMAEHERTVSDVRCARCQTMARVRGIVEYLVFASEHRHDEQD